MDIIQVSISRATQTNLVVRGKQKAEILMKPQRQAVRIVQSASPLPIGGGQVADPGDLTLLFDNQLV